MINFQTNSFKKKDHASIALQTQYQIVFDQIITLGLLSAAGRVDECICINNRQKEITQSFTEYSNKLLKCLDNVDIETLLIKNNYTYRVDVVMTKVNNIEHQFNQCCESLLCINNLLF